MSKPLMIAVAISIQVLVVCAGYAALKLYDAAKGAEARAELPVLYEVPPFSLTDSQGETFSLSDLDGKVWVAEFFFTSCPGVCPTMMTRMAELHTRFADDPRVHFVGFSADPETDTPERMAEYLARYKGDPARWHLLTGPIEKIQALSLEGFKLGSLESPEMHSSRFTLVDAQGRIRGYYDGLAPEEVTVLSDAIQRLL